MAEDESGSRILGRRSTWCGRLSAKSSTWITKSRQMQGLRFGCVYLSDSVGRWDRVFGGRMVIGRARSVLILIANALSCGVYLL